HEDVQRLRLVDPFGAAGGAFDDPLRIDLEGGCIQLAKVRGNAVDAGQAAVEVFDVGDHDRIPQAPFLEVTHQVFVDHGELAGEVRFHVQVAIVRLDAGRHADDVRDGRRGRGRDAVGVAHAVLTDVVAQRIPVQRLGGVHVDIAATCF